MWPIYEPEPVGTGFPLGSVTPFNFTYDDSGGAFEPWHLVECLLFFYINSFALYEDCNKMFGSPIAPSISKIRAVSDP